MVEQRVGVLMGGTSREREVSLTSGHAVVAALRDAGHTVVPIDVGSGLGWLGRLQKSRIDVAFLALHGRLGEDGCVQGALELLKIPYTGSSVLASALGMDKVKSKELFRLHNLPTPASYVVSGKPDRQAILEQHQSFGYPVVIKPRSEGSSFGIYRAEGPEGLVDGVSRALELENQVLVERMIRGREVTVGILEGRVLGALEVVPAKGIYDYESKYTPGATTYHVPARLSPELYRNVLNLGECAADALGVTGAARIDLMISELDNEFILEVNTLPGMTPTSLLPKIAASAGFSFVDLCQAILAGARLHVATPETKRDMGLAKVVRTLEPRVEALTG